MHITERRLAWTATTGISLFAADVALLPLAQRGHYDPLHQTISELALGRFGRLQDVAFCVLAVATFALSAVLRRQLPQARVAVVALGLAGATDLVSATFHAVLTGEPQTTSSLVHIVAGTLTFLLTILAMATLVRHLAADPRWHAWSRPTLVWAIALATAMFLLGPHNLGRWFGLGQRIIAACNLSWMVLTSLRAGRVAATRAAGPAVPATEGNRPTDARTP